MITLTQYNQQDDKKEEEHRLRKLTSHLTGIQCEKCDGEYMKDDMVNASNPPPKWIKCNKCGDIQLIRWGF